ncbi:MAG: GntR family transcriptional regulator [Rhodobacteraceae bacterium]|nr:GntR family transcriptional regulator [Paracoccaceae bacterium]QEW23480.1 HTH-type transcriptional repressor YvoA [Paracoccaceae bacterium]
MSSRPIYAELSDELIREIREGTYPVGALLPTELEMAAARKLSRSTVRAALNRLVSLGLITRQKGVGTRVVSAGPAEYDASTTSIEGLAHFGEATHREIQGVREIVADESLAGLLGCKPGTRWIDVSVIRTAPGSGDPPICWTDNYVDPTYAAIVPDIAAYPGLIADLIAKNYGAEVDEVHQTIRPTLLPDDAARVLSARAGEPALQIVRRYMSASRVVYISVNLHPGSRFEYSMSLRRSGRQ